MMSTTRAVSDADLQVVLRFFAVQAVAHLSRFGELPPACVLVWLHAEQAEVAAVHQFPASEVVELLRTEAGKHKLAIAIQGFLDGTGASGAPRPHVVVQVLLAAVPEGEALLLLVHASGASYAIALHVNGSAELTLPVVFDLQASRLSVDS